MDRLKEIHGQEIVTVPPKDVIDSSEQSVNTLFITEPNVPVPKKLAPPPAMLTDHIPKKQLTSKVNGIADPTIESPEQPFSLHVVMVVIPEGVK